MDKLELNRKLKDLDTRAEKIRKAKSALEKSQAVKEHQYEEALTKLKDLGIDAENMKASELKKLLATTESELEDALTAMEDTIKECEDILAEFQGI
jgi:arsenate reductase-like glutaredoxin family protein